GDDVVLEIAGREAIEKFVALQVVGDVAVGQIPEFVAALQMVDGDDVALPARVQPFHQVGADEAGRAGHDQIHASTPKPKPLMSVAAASTRMITRGATPHKSS